MSFGYAASDDWVRCEECGMPMNAMRLKADGLYYPSPLYSKELALGRLEGHRRVHHSRPVNARRPPLPGGPIRFIIFNRPDEKDRRRRNLGMMADSGDRKIIIPPGAKIVKQGRRRTLLEADRTFQSLARTSMANRRYRRKSYYKGRAVAPAVPYDCPRCGRHTADARKVPEYPERRCRAGCV